MQKQKIRGRKGIDGLAKASGSVPLVDVKTKPKIKANLNLVAA